MVFETPLDGNEATAAALGRLVGKWGALEHQLIGTLMVLLRIDFARAQMVFNSFPGFFQKLNLLERLTHTFMRDCDEKTELLKLFTRVRDQTNVRNYYVHSLWMSDPDNVMHVQSIPLGSNTKKPENPIDRADLGKLLEAVNAAATLISDFSDFKMFHGVALVQAIGDRIKNDDQMIYLRDRD
jgi:hypothetical protein